MAKKKFEIREFKCPDCHDLHRWERLGTRSNLLLRKRGITGQNYGWKTSECKGPTTKGRSLYIERVMP